MRMKQEKQKLAAGAIKISILFTIQHILQCLHSHDFWG